jgi:nucleoside phosphorylase
LHEAVTGAGANAGFELRRVLQHYYFASYIEEYRPVRIAGFPFVRDEFDLPAPGRAYEYPALRQALLPLGLWSLITSLSARSMLHLREMTGYYLFREAYHIAANSVTSRQELGYVFAELARSARIKPPSINMREPPRRGVVLRASELEDVDAILGLVAEFGLRLFSTESETGCSYAPDGGGGELTMSAEPSADESVIAIYVALEEEREFLARRWSLSHRFSEFGWTGSYAGVQLMIYGVDEMGRVPAAVQTMKCVAARRPRMIVVLGIAGGFSEARVELGDAIVATAVIDLAGRKIRDEAKGAVPQFRPHAFDASRSIVAFLKSGSFDVGRWEQDVIRDGDWPKGRRPSLRFGAIASMDEVISSNDWRQQLLAAWPLLQGVEMEAGGVCWAALESCTPVSVIRGVSDMADPSKSDSEWRRRAVGVAAATLEAALRSPEWRASLARKLN